MFIQPGRRWPAREVGELAGLKIVVAGESDTPPLWRLRGGMYVRADDTTYLLRRELRQYDATNFTLMVAGMSATRLMDTQRVSDVLGKVSHPSAILRHFQLALLLHLLYTDPSREDWGGVHVTLNELADLCLMSANMRCKADEAAEDEPEMWAMVYRMFYQQFWDFRDLTTWSRGLQILREMPRTVQHTSSAFDLNKEFARLYEGISFDEFLFLGFALFTAVTQQPGRVVDEATFKNFQVLPQSVSAFLRLIARDFEALRAQNDQWMEKGVNPPGFEPFHLNPLRRWPAVKLPDGRITVPIPRFLLERITTGIYFDFMESLSENLRSRFGDLWGHAFQEYVGALMKSQVGFEGLIPEREFQWQGKQDLTCDWMIREGDVAILIECKTRGLGPRARVACLKEDIERDISRRYSRNPQSSLAGGLAKLFKVRDAILGHAQGLEPLHGVSNVISVLLTLDSLPEGNRNYFRGIMEQQAAKFGAAVDPNWQMVDIDGFERFCCVVHTTSQSPGKLMSEKLSNPGRTAQDSLDYFWGLAPNLKVMDHPLHQSGRARFEELVGEYAGDRQSG